MEQPSESAAPMAASKQKNGGGLKAFAAIASIVALAGIGFGVYGMIQANNASNKDLKIEVKNADGTVSTIEADKIEVKDGGNVAVVSEPIEKEDSSRYIYIGEWGLKIKLPDEIAYAEYTLTYDLNNAWGVLYVTGAPKGLQAMPSYSDVRECQLGAVHVVTTSRDELEKTKDLYRNPFMTHGDLVFTYSHPQALCSNDKDGESKMAGYIEKMLSNPDNYSAI